MYYIAMIDILRQFSEHRMREQAETEKSKAALERDILVCCVRKMALFIIDFSS